MPGVRTWARQQAVSTRKRVTRAENRFQGALDTTQGLVAKTLSTVRGVLEHPGHRVRGVIQSTVRGVDGAARKLRR